jgi:phosphomethylpyrimidine synthase
MKTKKVKKITTGNLPASKKIYENGSIFQDLRVPMREITLHPTSNEPPVLVYDSSGPYTDENTKIIINKGLSRLRTNWIIEREDVEYYQGRKIKSADNGFVNEKSLVPEFDNISDPLKAKKNKAVTQLFYARQGTVTREMEYVAIY